MDRLEELLELIDSADADTTPDLSGFTAEELRDAEAAVRAAGREAAASVQDGSAEDIDAARERVAALLSALDVIEAEQADRQTAAAELEAQAARFGTDDDEPADGEPADDDDVEPAPVPAVQASSARLRDMVRQRPAANAPVVEQTPRQVLHAAVGSGDEMGEAFAQVSDLGRAMVNRFRNLTPRDDVAEVRSPVARLAWGEQYRIGDNDTSEQFAARLYRLQFEAQRAARADLDRMLAGQAPRTLQAATGICGPAEPIYDQYTVIGQDGMFNIPTLGARRGSISVPDSLSYVDFDGEEGVAFPYTSAEGAAGSKTKVCLEVACDTPTEFEVTAYQTCLTYSNFMGQFYPERVGAAGTTALAAHAHRVNKILIDAAETQAVADGTSYGSTDTGGGAIVQFGSSVAFHAAAYRDKYRMPLNSVIDVHVPHWVKEALFADALARQSTTDYNRVTALLMNFLAGCNVRINFVHDWQSLTELGLGYYPSTVDLLMFPAGTVVRITGETLDLGVVRDSVLNSQNEFRTFVETFDGIAKIGHEIMRVADVQVIPNGEVGQQVAITNPTGS